MSIWTALAAERIKTPAEKSMLLHLLWLRELLERGVLSALNWLDTRVMTADGHTKGSIERDTLRELAGGVMPRVSSDMVKVLKFKHDHSDKLPVSERQEQKAAKNTRHSQAYATRMAEEAQCVRLNSAPQCVRLKNSYDGRDTFLKTSD